MYAQFFGLTQAPFSIAPDPRYLFMSERHREALAHLLYGLQGGGGFVLLSGEIGAGKTTVCRCFLEQVPANCNVAYIFNPKLTVTELLQSICAEFHIPLPAVGPATVKDYLDPLNTFLLRTHALGQNNLLVIDEAQLLSAQVLEQLRLLTNLETSERKLLQIVLIGQPELRQLLARPELEQLAQRVIARFHLEALSAVETAQYIAHRLAVAGRSAASPFDARALRLIYRRSRGVPRRINLLCDRALLGAYASGRAIVDRAIVKQAASEVFGDPIGPVTGATGATGVAGMVARAVAGASGAAGKVGVASVRRAALRHRSQVWRIAALGALTVFGALLLGVGVYGLVDTRRDPDRSVALGSAVAAPAVAAVALLAGLAPTPSLATPQQVEQAAFRDEASAWRELGLGWQRAPDPADTGDTTDAASAAPCSGAQHPPLACFRVPASTLALIRQLDRPGLVTLRGAPGRGSAAVYALLTGLTGQSVTLRLNGVSMTLPLAQFAALWQGDFATLWRAPADYLAPLGPGARGALVDQLGAQLAAFDAQPAPPPGQVFDAALKARVHAFQLAQGLRPDGWAGPTTFMQLNRAGGVAEPRLSAMAEAQRSVPASASIPFPTPSAPLPKTRP